MDGWLTILILHISIFVLSTWLNSETSQKRVFNAWSYFAVWWYMFTVFITLAYSLFILWGNTSFKLSCDSVQKASNDFIDFFANPLKMGLNEVKSTKDKVSDFFETDVKDFLHIGQNITLQWEKLLQQETDKNLAYVVADKFNSLQSMISKAMKDTSVVNTGICELFVEKIQEEYQKPIFQISVLILMVLLIIPFMRVAFWIVTLLALILFKILYRMKIYKIRKVPQEVEEIF